MWLLAELCLGVLNWSPHKWRQIGFMTMACAISGWCLAQGISTPIWGRQKTPTKPFLKEMLIKFDDESREV